MKLLKENMLTLNYETTKEKKNTSGHWCEQSFFEVRPQKCSQETDLMSDGDKSYREE